MKFVRFTLFQMFLITTMVCVACGVYANPGLFVAGVVAWMFFSFAVSICCDDSDGEVFFGVLLIPILFFILITLVSSEDV